jgi:hypothetical protein
VHLRRRRPGHRGGPGKNIELVGKNIWAYFKASKEKAFEGTGSSFE